MGDHSECFLNMQDCPKSKKNVQASHISELVGFRLRLCSSDARVGQHIFIKCGYFEKFRVGILNRTLSNTRKCGGCYETMMDAQDKKATASVAFRMLILFSGSLLEFLDNLVAEGWSTAWRREGDSNPR